MKFFVYISQWNIFRQKIDIIKLPIIIIAQNIEKFGINYNLVVHLIIL